METLDPNLSPNKRQKTESLTLDSTILDKGKAPVEEDDGDDDETPPQLPPQNCGICFSDEGKTVRGLIDSCDHYFCFLCVVEWSKIESRCPLCRGRFSSIRRMRKDGSFIGTGSVRVGVRDQIYDPFGEPVDPYGQAKCSVCNGMKDETLLLLCDLCDSASHTYCVGLGATVPEGDWYCPDCELLRAEKSDSEIDDDVETSAVPKQAVELEQGNADESPSTTATVSIFDIVREPREQRKADSGTDRLLKLVSSRPTKFSSSAIVSDQPIIASARSSPIARGNLICPLNNRDSNARTLRNCREVHRHINVLRDNWDAIRTGSLSFPSKPSCPSGQVSRKMNKAAISVKGSCQMQSASPSTKSSKQKAQESLCDAAQKEQTYNVQRAWKLMSAAKSLAQPNKAKSVCKTTPTKVHDPKSDNPVSKSVLSSKKDPMCTPLGMEKRIKNLSGSLDQRAGKHQVSNIIPTAASTSANKYHESRVPRFYAATEVQTATPHGIYSNGPSLRSCGELGRGESSACFDDFACSRGSPAPTGLPDVSSTRSARNRISTFPLRQDGNIYLCVDSRDATQTFVETDFCHDVAGLTSGTSRGCRSSNTSAERHISVHSALPQETVAGASDVSSTKLKEKEVSGYSRDYEAKITRKTRKDDRAKGEILSLVKLNLKLLGKEKRLESGTFKEIARLSTHTILASCGFEHRDIVRSIPTLVCHHSNSIQQLPRSAIVPTSCRDCFNSFVKNVVNTVLSEKISSYPVVC